MYVYVYPVCCTKLNSKLMKGLSIRPNIPNLLEEEVENILYLIGIGKDCLNKISLVQALIPKINKCDLMKLKSSVRQKTSKNAWRGRVWNEK